MTPELYALAAQIITLPGWEWRRGMRVFFYRDSGVVYWDADPGENPIICFDSEKPPLQLEEWQMPALPDLTDPATAGAMLGMLSKQLVQAQVTPDGWRVVMVFTDLSPSASARAATLGEAIARLVVARGGWR